MNGLAWRRVARPAAVMTALALAGVVQAGDGRMSVQVHAPGVSVGVSTWPQQVQRPRPASPTVIVVPQVVIVSPPQRSSYPGLRPHAAQAPGVVVWSGGAPVHGVPPGHFHAHGPRYPGVQTGPGRHGGSPHAWPGHHDGSPHGGYGRP